MADVLAEVEDEHPEQVAGSSYCSDRQGLAVFVKPGAADVEAALAQAAAQYPEFGFELIYVPRSMTEMQGLSRQVVEAGLDELGLVGVGPDVYTGGLLVTVLSEGDEAGEPIDGLIAGAEDAVKGIVGDDVPVDVEVTTSEFVTS
ncbi:MAG: hypothetical protein LBD77_02015 [Bifidobacteriaceae bacterium]|nr:hypothetical protein [Bifidobacteriaceae bacterium]